MIDTTAQEWAKNPGSAPTGYVPPTPAPVGQSSMTNGAKYGSPATGYFPNYPDAVAAAEAILKSGKISNPGGPSSSASQILNTNTDSALNAIKNPQQPTAMTDIQQYVASTLGLGEDFARQLDPASMAQFALQRNSQMSAEASAKKSEEFLQRQYDASLAQENAQYAQASKEIETHRQGAMSEGQRAAYAANPFAATSSAKGGYTDSINRKYDSLQGTLTLQAQQAKAALDAGNFEAYAKIQSSLEQTKQTGLANIQKFIQDYQKQEIQKDQFNTTQKNTWADNFLNQLSKIDYTPEEIDARIKSGAIEKDPTFQAGLQAGYDKQGVIDAMKSGSIAASKLKLDQQKVLDAQIRAANSQAMIGTWSIQTDPGTGATFRVNSKTGAIEPISLADYQGTFGGAAVPESVSKTFLSGLQTINTGGGVTEKDKAAAYSVIGQALKSGNTQLAKTQLKNYAIGSMSQQSQDIYNGMNTVTSNLAMIRQDIKSLPANIQTDFISGNWEKGLEKVGTTNSTLLAKLKTEIEATKFAYTNQISGKQFTDAESKRYAGVLPDISNEKSLNLAKMDGFLKIVNNTTDSVVRQRIGADTYNQIYGGGTAAKSGFTTSVNGQTYTFPTQAALDSFKKDAGIK